MTEENKKNPKNKVVLSSDAIKKAANKDREVSMGDLPKSSRLTLESLLKPSNTLGDIVKQSNRLSDLAKQSNQFDEIIKKSTSFNSLFYPHILNAFGEQSDSERATLEDQISKLKKEIAQMSQKLANAENNETQAVALVAKIEELQEKQNLTHILNRVGEEGAKKIFKDPAFRAQFQNGSPCKAFVLSIDIRRSTELMLKSRDSKLFATFVTTLAVSLRRIVLENLGVFDKFTGDGILAIFPDFYSGNDAGFRAINAATMCHVAFNEIYKAHRSCFMAVLKDAGLGIGVDYGDVQIVEIGGEFTVVGTPVVYACRMSGAPAYQTLVNQPAYEQLFEKYANFDFEESEIEIKHEGKTIAYKVSQNGKSFNPEEPAWLTE